MVDIEKSRKPQETVENHRVEYYLSIKYPVLIYEDEDGGFVAEVPDLPGCLTQAETWSELMEMIEDARRSWIEVAYEDGREIPLPRTETEYSGKFLLRVPVSLHRSLAQTATSEGVSLNHYVVFLLTRNLDLDVISRQIGTVGNRVAALERSVHYAIGPMPVPSKQEQSRASGAKLLFGKKDAQAVAS